MRDFGSYIALGDSFTEGMGDPVSRAGVSTSRGWADRLAEALARQQPGVRYANLAIRGKMTRQVLDEQVPRAVAMAPGLVSIAAGGNDLLGLRGDPDRVAETFEEAVAALARSGATVMVFTGFDPMTFPVLRLIRGRAAVYSMHLRDIASRYGCLLADLWSMRVLADRRMWSADRLHLSPEGHRRVGLLAAETVGLETTGDWRTPLPPGPLATWWAARRADASWAGEHAAPWAYRRLRGRSSGDLLSPKLPDLVSLDGGLGPVTLVRRGKLLGWPDGSRT